MAAETLTANGLNLLPSRVHRTPDLSSILAGPARRTDDVTVAKRHGRLRTPNKLYDAAEFVLPFWVIGINRDGTIPADGNRAFYDRVTEIVAAFGAETVELVRGLPDGTSRRIVVEQLAALDPSRKLPGELGQLSFKVSAADPPFWTDLGAPRVATGTCTGAATPWVLTPFAGATAPMDDLVLRLTATSGSVPNPRVEHAGRSVSYLATLATGQYVELDCGTWEVVGGGGLTRDYARVRKTGGGARYLSVVPGPDPAVAPVATLSHTGTGTLTATLTGRRKHKVG